MWSIIRRTIKNRRGAIIAYCVIAIALLWMMVAMYPSIAEQADEFNELIDTYPEAFLNAFGIERDTILFDSLESFTALEFYSLIWPLVAIILGISFGGWTIAGEVDAGTIELMLSLPISRARQYVAKYLAGVVMVAIFVFVTVFSVMPLAWLHGVDLNLKAHFAILLIGGVMTLAVFSLSMMFSSYLSERGKASSIAAGIIAVMYAINIVASLKDNLESLQYLSFFYYYDYADALKNSSVDPLHIGVFVGVSVISFAVGLIGFSKRDVAV